MPLIRKIFIFFITLFIFSTSFPRNVHAGISNAAVLFLKIVDSPQATSMGGCVANNVNEQSALYSPGAFGIFHLDKNFSISFPINTKWLPELADNIRLKTFGISGGYSFSISNNKPNSNPRIGIGIAYSTFKLDYGTVIRTNAQGNVIGTAHPYDKSTNLTIGVGFESLVRIGIGITYKRIESKMSRVGGGAELEYSIAKGSAIDYGAMIEFPFSNIASLSSQDKANNIKFDLIPSVSYVKANIGDDISYIAVANADPLPKFSRIGLSMVGNFNRNNLPLASLRFVYEIEKSLYGNSKDKVYRTGYEIGILGFLNCRFGHINDDPGDIHINTYGFGVSLKGITSRFFNNGSNNKTMKYLIDNLDITFNYAKYAKDNEETLSNTNFLNISLSI